MKNTVLAAAAAVAIGVLASVSVRSQDTTFPLRTGYVDVRRVIQEWKKREQVEKTLDSKSAALDARFKADRARIEEKEQKLATLNETSDDFQRLLREIDGDKLLHKRDREYEQMRLQRQQRHEFWMLYKAVVTEARAVAEAKGLASVLTWSPMQELEKEQDPLAIIPTRAVLWSDPRLDLTEEVLTSLNAQLPK